MIRTDKIFVTIDEASRLSINTVQQALECNLRRVASSTRFRVEKRDTQIEVILESPIALTTVNKILNDFIEKRLIIKKFYWERIDYGAFRRGHLQIIVF